MKKKTTEQYIKEVQERYGDKITVLEKYNGKSPIMHRCNICGNNFLVNPDNFLHKWKTFCLNCKEPKENVNKGQKLKKYSFQETVNIANEIHDNRYIYPEQKYTNLHDKASIICPKHGKFIKTWVNHIFNKQGCLKCAKEDKLYKEKQKFLETASNIYGAKYDYSEVVYVNNSTPVKIKCNDCGNVFYMAPQNHIRQHQGCPKCARSKNNEFIDNYLTNLNIEHIMEYKHPG